MRLLALVAAAVAGCSKPEPSLIEQAAAREQQKIVKEWADALRADPTLRLCVGNRIYVCRPDPE